MIELKNVGGKDRTFRCNQGAMDVYFQRINYNEVGASAIYATFYAGLIGDAIYRGEQVDFTYGDVVDWVEGIYEDGRKEDIEKVCNVFAEANAYKTRLAELVNRIKDVDEVKKKKPLKVKSS
jgi:hypothetical protein